MKAGRFSLFSRCYQRIALLLCLCFLSVNIAAAGVDQAVRTSDGFNYAGKKVLYINSYHAGYPWSDGIERGIRSRFLVEDVWLKTHYMDAKRERTLEALALATRDALEAIDTLQPDIVIISDDIAAKYVLEPHYKNVSLPFVYCGINWVASVYGLPYKNTTGMVEVSLVASLVDLLSAYASGKRIGFLSVDALSEHRMLEHFEHTLNRKLEHAYFVNTMAEWESKFIDLQQQVDYMILGNPVGIENWNEPAAKLFVNQQVRIPIGAAQEWLAPLALITIAKIPEEQGWWSAEQALKILRGIAPADIPGSKNRQGKLFANLAMAQKLDVTLSAEILHTAELVDQ